MPRRELIVAVADSARTEPTLRSIPPVRITTETDKLHSTINSVQDNRFAREFQALISMIFHYHYQWNKRSEKQRNALAVSEHLNYINGLRSRDWDVASGAALSHLATARQTLLASTGSD